MEILKNQQSAAQYVWVFFIRLIGVIMFIAPLFKPVKHYFLDDADNVLLKGADWVFVAVGFLLSSGGKSIGIIINNLGIGLTNLINKLTK